MIEVRINGQGLRGLLAAPPRTDDQMNAVCRTLEVQIQNAQELENYLGQQVELWVDNKRWYVGNLRKRIKSSNGTIVYTAYDPLYFVAKNPDDYYIENETANQAIKTAATNIGLRIANLTNTGVVLGPLLYLGTEANKVWVDLIARTHEQTTKRFYYRYQPDYDKEGLLLYERVVPKKVWAFQVGVNLESVEMEESVEDIVTVIKLVNRDTGKIVTKVANEAAKQYGKTVHFEEVSKDKDKIMETLAQKLLDKLSKVAITVKADGVNPGNMPQFFSGDVIYVQEPNTGLMAGYYIRNVSQSFESDKLIKLAFDITITPDLPEVEIEDADEQGKKKKDSSGKGVQENYSKEVQDALSEYGL